MLMRSMLGSLAAVGVIGAMAAALPEHNAAKKTAPVTVPGFGGLPRTTTAAGQDGTTAIDTQSLIRLAAYSTAQADAAAATPGTPPALVPATVTPPPSVGTQALQHTGPADARGVQPATTAALSSPEPATPALAPVSAEPSRPGNPQTKPMAVAALPPADAASPVPSGAKGRVNINHASVAELDHLPGGGRIGVAIARRRPYGTVDDLVRKRVIRAGLLSRIRPAITVD